MFFKNEFWCSDDSLSSNERESFIENNEQVMRTVVPYLSSSVRFKQEVKILLSVE